MYYYDSKFGREYCDAPIRRLSQSYQLDMIAGRSVTSKQVEIQFFYTSIGGLNFSALKQFSNGLELKDFVIDFLIHSFGFNSSIFRIVMFKFCLIAFTINNRKYYFNS